MPLDITFTLSDRDLERFRTIVEKARTTNTDSLSMIEIERAAYKIVDIATNTDLPDFIAKRLLQLKILLEMLKDEDWQVSDNERKSIMSALAYFSDPIDLLPDHIPGIGFLDDAMFVEIIIRELSYELEAYSEFSQFRTDEESRLTAAGENPDANKSQWLGAKRAELQTQIKAARGAADEDEFIFQLL
jgi:uncharacterized membrane protein YkvA (DUF1232 family)